MVSAISKPSSSAPPLRNGGVLLGKQSGRQNHRNLTCKTSESKGAEEVLKKRKVVSFEDRGSPESPTAAEENVFAPPCLVILDSGIRISTVAAGGRHTLALSGMYSFSYDLIFPHFGNIYSALNCVLSTLVGTFKC